MHLYSSMSISSYRFNGKTQLRLSLTILITALVLGLTSGGKHKSRTGSNHAKYSSASYSSSDASPDCLKLRDKYRIGNLFDPVKNNQEDILMFMHIPKNAGALIGKHMNSRRFIDRSRFTHAACPCSIWHVPPRYFRVRMNYSTSHPNEAQLNNPYRVGNKTVFCIIRDPVDKALSAFKMKARDQLNSPRIVDMANTFLSVPQFNSTGQDCHLYSQYKYVWDENGVKTCDIALRYEEGNIYEKYNSLVQAFPRSNNPLIADTSHVQLSHHQELVYPFTVANLSTEVIELLHQYYWPDMCLFGYNVSVSKPDWYSDDDLDTRIRHSLYHAIQGRLDLGLKE